MGDAMSFFKKSYCAMKYFTSWFPGLQIFFEKFEKPSDLPPTMLMYPDLNAYRLSAII